MRFKYYMRGMGVGILLTTLLFTLNIHFGSKANAKAEEPQVQEEIQEEAVVQEQEPVVEEADATVEEQAVSEEAQANETTEEPVDEESESEDVTITYVPFTVHGGDSSEVVSSNLHKLGLIDSVDDFNKYMKTVGVDHRIQAGTFYVKEGSSYDDLVALLVNKDTRTTTPPKND